MTDPVEKLGPELFDRETRLPGPLALRRALARDFEYARKYGKTIGLVAVHAGTRDEARGVAQALRSIRGHQDVAARIDKHLFSLEIGVNYKGESSATGEVIEARLAEHGVRFEVFWLQRAHRSADDLYREVLAWVP